MSASFMLDPIYGQGAGQNRCDDRWATLTPVDDDISEPPSADELEYLRRVERMAHAVAEAAAGEGWLSFLPDPPEATSSQSAVNAMARRLRFTHSHGDGCLDHD
ncbi:hypothetical protein ABZ946_26030 [Streptomyces sp. NPDC046324]|uniref:hypothetical protein n=1 Tax=Streptomyces sp. NPDC046324 TaxID=3154915 RepID=UPI0033E0B4BD